MPEKPTAIGLSAVDSPSDQVAAARPVLKSLGQKFNALLGWIGDAASKSVGVAPGQIPIIGSDGKLPPAVLPEVALVTNKPPDWLRFDRYNSELSTSRPFHYTTTWVVPADAKRLEVTKNNHSSPNTPNYLYQSEITGLGAPIYDSGVKIYDVPPGAPITATLKIGYFSGSIRIIVHY